MNGETGGEMNDDQQTDLQPLREGSPTLVNVDSSLPEIVRLAGPSAKFAYEEFFYARIRNAHTRKAYRHAMHRFL